MAQRRIGIELDSNRAALVCLDGSRVVRTQTFVAETQEDAFSAALSAASSLRGRRKQRSSVRAALYAPGIGVRRIEVKAANIVNRAVFEQHVFDTLEIDGTDRTVAGLLPRADTLVGDSVAPAVAAAAPAGLLAGLFARADVDTEIVPSAFCLAETTGLILSLRWSVTELTFVDAGQPIAHRQLSTGGLDRVADALNRGAGGIEQLETVLAGRPEAEAIAAGALDKHITAIADEVHQTLGQWERTGVPKVDTVAVVGPGSSAPALTDRLLAHGLTAYQSPAIENALAEMAAADRRNVAGAWLAATSADFGGQAATFANPHILAQRAARRARTQSTRRIAIAVAAIVLVIGVVYGPTYYKNQRVPDAKKALATAAQQANHYRLALSGVQAQSLLAGHVKDLQAGEPRWEVLAANVYNSAPSDVTIQSVDLELVRGSGDTSTPAANTNLGPTDGTLTVMVTGIAPTGGTSPTNAGEFPPLTTWMHDLSSAPLFAQQVWSPSFTASGTKVSFTISFQFPLKSLAGGK